MGTRRHPDRDVDADYDEHAVPLDHTATKSNTPVSKAIVIRLERS
jgi:hypothetical protein